MGNLAIVLTARPSYAKLKPVIRELTALGEQPDIYVCASALLDRYGRIVTQVAQDFPSLTIVPVYSVVEGTEPVSMALSTGGLTSALATLFAIRKPRMVVVMADRHETLAVSIAASYQNIPLVHMQGGEVSGNIDDKVRNANTMLADYHFPATARARANVEQITQTWDGDNKTMFLYGCPSIDVARLAKDQPPVTDLELGGDGPPMDLSEPFITVLQHPTTILSHMAYGDMMLTLEIANLSRLPLLVFWPGQDAGQEGASKAIRVFRHFHSIRTKHTLPPERFLRLMYQTTALVGNSSVGIRECSYIGTPFFNVGNRQKGREHATNTMEAWPNGVQLGPRSLDKRPSSNLYGDGHAAPKIAAKLKELLWQLR